MNHLNSLLIEGDLVDDPKIRHPPQGNAVCNFTIASSRFCRVGIGILKEVGFFNIEAEGKLAEACAERGSKGRGVRVVGRLRHDHWKDDDGNCHDRIVIVPEHVEFRPVFKKQQDETPSTAALDLFDVEAPVEEMAEAV